MSIRIMTLAWTVDLAASEKLVLLALADWSNDDGECWPSMRQLMDKCGLTDRGVQKIMRRLVDLRHVTRFEVPGRGNRYTVHPGGHEAAEKPRTPERGSPRTKFPPNHRAQTPERGSDNTSVTTNTSDADASSVARATRLPVGWQPVPFPGDLSAEVALMPAGWIERHLARFRDYWAAKAGAGGRKLDWDATWRNWIRKELENDSRTRPARPGAAGGASCDKDGFAAGIERAVAASCRGDVDFGSPDPGDDLR